MGLFCASFSLRMGQFSNPVATHPRTNKVEVTPPLAGVDGCTPAHKDLFVYIMNAE